MKAHIEMTRGDLDEIREYDSLEQCLLELEDEFGEGRFVVYAPYRVHEYDWNVEIYNYYRE